MSGPHQIVISARSERDLAQLPERIAAACVEFIFDEFADTPSGSESLSAPSWRGATPPGAGDFRIIYRIDEDRRRVEILHIGRRSDITVGKTHNTVQRPGMVTNPHAKAAFSPAATAPGSNPRMSTGPGHGSWIISLPQRGLGSACPRAGVGPPIGLTLQ